VGREMNVGWSEMLDGVRLALMGNDARGIGLDGSAGSTGISIGSGSSPDEVASGVGTKDAGDKRLAVRVSRCWSMCLQHFMTYLLD